jgi:phosphohistidine phosphatase
VFVGSRPKEFWLVGIHVVNVNVGNMEQFTIYLVRHGLAGQPGSHEDDALRPLTSEGQTKTRRVGKRLRHLSVEFDRMLVSPYVRAQQTAEIFKSLGLADNLETVDYLKPDGAFEALLADLRPLAKVDAKVDAKPADSSEESSDEASSELSGEDDSSEPTPGSIALVGHEPMLSMVAAQLIFGQTIGRLRLKKAGIIAISAPVEGNLLGECELLWMVSPKLILD